jgi:TonB family protein
MRSARLFMIGLLPILVQGCASKAKEAYVALDPMPRQWQVDESKLPSKVINPNALQDPAFGTWIVHHDGRIQQQWQAKPFQKALSCKVTVSKNGDLSNVQIVKSSGSQPVDKAAVDLIAASGPFLPLPGTFSQQSFLVEFRDFPTVFLSRIKAEQK